MNVDKLSISMEPGMSTQVRDAAARAGVPVSRWVASAVAAKLRAQALADYLEEFEASHGALTDQEVRSARVELGLVATE